MEVRATETFNRIVGAAYLVAINQYASRSSHLEIGNNDQLDKNRRAAQIARSTLISNESISIVSGSLATFQAVRKGWASNHYSQITESSPWLF